MATQCLNCGNTRMEVTIYSGAHEVSSVRMRRWFEIMFEFKGRFKTELGADWNGGNTMTLAEPYVSKAGFVIADRRYPFSFTGVNNEKTLQNVSYTGEGSAPASLPETTELELGPYVPAKGDIALEAKDYPAGVTIEPEEAHGVSNESNENTIDAKFNGQLETETADGYIEFSMTTLGCCPKRKSLGVWDCNNESA